MGSIANDILTAAKNRLQNNNSNIHNMSKIVRSEHIQI